MLSRLFLFLHINTDFLENQKVYYQEQFNQEYNKLNKQQRLAVETTEGPVMVVAGPGTGKTQVLSTRIAYILKEGLADAENILCLTYTDAGALAMQNRLNNMIGSAGAKISIHTFHSFCNRVIAENPNIFNIRYDYRLAEKIDEYELLETLLEKIPEDNILYRPDQKYETAIRGTLELIQTIKKENWNVDSLKKAILQRMEEMKTDDEFIYKRDGKNYKKGDLKINDYKKECDKYRKSLSALELYPEYSRQLRERGLYDFNDLINLVISEFHKNDHLLGIYQERFQYILVDEFQDTNGSQLEILRLLISYWDRPNIFVVGDSDQAIYRFQGANIANLKNFKNQYEPLTIELSENYRSTQGILNLSENFISANKERMKESDSIGIPLHANSKYGNSTPVLKKYPTIYDEVSDVAEQIQQTLAKEGVSPEKIAVLFRKNADAEAIVKELELRNISYSFSREINVLEHPLIKSLFLILEYIEAEYNNPFQNDNLLYEILHAPYVQLSTRDIGMLAIQLRTENKNVIREEESQSLRYVLGDKEFLIRAKVNNPEYILVLVDRINKLIKEKNYFTIQVFIEKILYDFEILKFVLHEEDSMDLLEILNSFFEYIKKLTVRFPDITIKFLDEHIRKLKKYSLTIPYISIVGSGQKVRISTIHSSKGLEYNYVYIIHNTKRRNANNTGFKLPAGYSYQGAESDHEEERRLFYVGLTRAEKYLHMSFAEKDSEGKQKELSTELQEVEKLDGIKKVPYESNASLLKDSLVRKLSFYRKKHELIQNELLDEFLKSFEMSVTSLEKYLRCPVAFYYEKVLRVPGARNAYMGFGRAVHGTFEDYFRQHSVLEKTESFEWQKLYEKNLKVYSSHFTKEEYKGYLLLGKDVIPKFVDCFSHEWCDVIKSRVEVDFKKRFYKGVPISGKLDRIDDLTDGIRIIDYKTGKPEGNEKLQRLKAPNDNDPLGGEYWRQMVFYSILCNTDPSLKEIKSGIFYYVVPNKDGKFIKSEIEINPEDKQIVGEQIETTYSRIKNREFEVGCNKKDCKWCSYVNNGTINISKNESELEEET